MSEDAHAALARLMNAFAARHWHDDGLTPARATLRIEGDTLLCTVGEDTIAGHPTAPLWFVTGAWALIFAHETDGRFGHRVAGRVNRIWPHGATHDRTEHGIADEARALAAHWPAQLLSASLYDGAHLSRRTRWPRVLDDAPGRTSLAGILKRAAGGAQDPDPLERLKVAEFIEHALRTEWRMTGEDAMWKAVGPALMALSDDTEPATRELAWLALETCAEACWQNRAYGVYEPICERLIERGANAHLHVARLAESAYADGDIAGGDARWATASAGQSPLRAVKLGPAHDHVGDWDDFHTRILRQAGGAHVARAAGIDPNPAREDKRAKRSGPAPDAETAARHRQLAHVLLQRAAEGARARLAIDLPALRAGGTVALGGGRIDPSARRLFLPEIFTLQARLAQLDGDETGRLRAMFAATDVAWQLAGTPGPWPHVPDDLVDAAAARDDATLQALGMPACLAPHVAARRDAQALAGTEAGREQLFWRRLLRKVRKTFLADVDDNHDPLPDDDLADGFTVRREGGTMLLSHPLLAVPVSGSLAAPVLTALQAWQQVLTAHQGHGARFDANDDDALTLDANEVAVMADLAAQSLAAGARDEAIALYRFAHGTDPLVMPWPDADEVPPLRGDAVPADLRAAVTHRSALAEDAALFKLKPRGRRVEQLAARYRSDDAVTARLIGHAMREAGGRAGDSEIVRVLKSGQDLLLALWAHPDPQVRETAILAIVMVLRMHRFHAPGLDASALRAAARDAGIAEPEDIDAEG